VNVRRYDEKNWYDTFIQPDLPYVLIFAAIGAVNFADRYSLDRMGK
jgi:hypothetical protein